MVDLQKKVLEENADLGVGLDGDVDRVIFVDNKGEIASADIIHALLSREFLKRESGASIIYDLRSSRIIKEVVESMGGNAFMWKVGHSFVKGKMKDENAIFGGELSGHYYFRDNFRGVHEEASMSFAIRSISFFRKSGSIVRFFGLIMIIES